MAQPGAFLVLGDDPLLGEVVEGVADVVRVVAGEKYAGNRNDGYVVRLTEPDDFVFLVRDLVGSGSIPQTILCGFALAIDNRVSADSVGRQRGLVFDALLYLAQAFAGEDLDDKQKWIVLTRKAHQVAAEQIHNPLGALSLGAAGVISNELPGAECKVIDVDTEDADRWDARQVRNDISNWGNGQVLAYRSHVRFSRTLERVPETDMAPANSIRRDGVYLITGGLGGLGVLAANELAREQPVRLVLVSRRKPPDRQYWQELIDIDAPEKEMLTAFLNAEDSGSEIMLTQCDVTDIEQVSNLKRRIEERFGEVNGILHTAGLVQDELIQRKEIESAHQVLAPKVLGTLNLHDVFDFARLDFCLLYSSTSAFTSLPGQVDYAVANAFLDAYAHYMGAEGVGQVASVNWPAWNETGVAVDMSNGVIKQPAGRPVKHPILDRVIEKNDAECVFSTLMNVNRFWLLDEHRTRDGHALIPGAGFLEIARAGFDEIHGSGAGVSFRDVANVLPFFVGNDETKELRLRISGDQRESRFVFFSTEEDEVIEYVTGQIGIVSDFPSESTDLTALKDRCNQRIQTFQDEDHHPFLQFGGRWQVLRQVLVGTQEAVINLNMDEAYRSEMLEYMLHPALVDMATAGAQVIMDDYDAQTDLFVPVGFGELACKGPLDAISYSHVRYRQGQDANHALFDVDLYHQDGTLMFRARDFQLQRVDKILAPNLVRGSDDSMENALSLGINNEEGCRALRQILEYGMTPQTIVSPVQIDHYLAEMLKPFASPAETVELVHDADADPDIKRIEQILVTHPAVDTVIVRSHLAENRSRRLIAHFLPQSGESVTISEIRRFAKDNLEAELVPKRFVEVHELPRNQSGEVDRTIYLDPFAAVDKYVAPATSTERQLARIWEDLLGISRVSRNDNFFDIGAVTRWSRSGPLYARRRSWGLLWIRRKWL